MWEVKKPPCVYFVGDEKAQGISYNTMSVDYEKINF